jgi:hypothetical protein
VSSHRLQIDSGRWTWPLRTKIDERKYAICNILEDEFHFILECSLNTDLRKIYIHKRYWKHPNMIKYVELLTIENVKIVRKLTWNLCIESF